MVKYYSDITKKTYDTEKEALIAEQMMTTTTGHRPREVVMEELDNLRAKYNSDLRDLRSEYERKLVNLMIELRDIDKDGITNFSCDTAISTSSSLTARNTNPVL